MLKKILIIGTIILNVKCFGRDLNSVDSNENKICIGKEDETENFKRLTRNLERLPYILKPGSLVLRKNRNIIFFKIKDLEEHLINYHNFSFEKINSIKENSWENKNKNLELESLINPDEVEIEILTQKKRIRNEETVIYEYKFFIEGTKRLFSGEKSFYDKRIKAVTEGKIINGKKEGLWKISYKNGNLEEENYKNGNLNGLKKSYDKNGKLVQEINYKDNIPHGIWNVYKNNILKIEANTVQGELHGVWKQYFENGNLEIEKNYKNGIYEGKWKVFYPSGKIAFEGNYKNDFADGEWKQYFENGELKYKGTYKKEELQGIGKVYDENGNTIKQENSKNKEIENVWSWYYSGFEEEEEEDTNL